MKITLITHYFPPEINAPAQRGFDHARIWKDQGHEVTIVTAQPSHPYGKIYPKFKNETEIHTIDGIKVHRLKTRLGENAGTLARSLNYASFMLSVWWHRKKFTSSDVVISTSPQFFCGYAGRFIARAAKCPWILEIRDVWPDSIIAVGAAKPSLATRILSEWVDLAYKLCDHIVSVSPGFQEHFTDRNVSPAKISLIPNGINAKYTETDSDLTCFPQLKTWKDKFVVSYIGTLGMAHSVATMIDAAEQLQDRDDIRFLIIGSGAKDKDLRQLVSEKGLSNVVILGQQPREMISALFNISDACLVHLKKQKVFETVIPTKLLEGMSMKKPILLGVQGVAKNILLKAQAGIAFEPENAGELVKAIGTLAEQPALAKEMGAAGQKFVRAHYDRTAMAIKYENLVLEIISKQKPKIT